MPGSAPLPSPVTGSDLPLGNQSLDFTNGARGGANLLDLAVKACVDSWWTGRRTTESIVTLLDAGADRTGIALPTGYPEADEVLRPR